MRLKTATYDLQSLVVEGLLPVMLVIILIGGTDAELFGAGWLMGWLFTHIVEK